MTNKINDADDAMDLTCGERLLAEGLSYLLDSSDNAVGVYDDDDTAEECGDGARIIGLYGTEDTYCSEAAEDTMEYGSEN